MINEQILKFAEESAQTLRQAVEQNAGQIAQAVDWIVVALRSGNKILLCGNGGSAADSQHIAAEFIGRFLKERKSLAAIALTTDTSILTAIGNDYGFEKVFSRQVEGLASAGDILIGISTSGNSANVIKAVCKARDMNVKTIALLGKDGGKLKDICDLAIVVPGGHTARIQEAHICIAHIICELVENHFTQS